MAAEGMTTGSDLKQRGHEIRAIGKISWPMSASHCYIGVCVWPGFRNYRPMP
jgi:hypothetical protein